MPRKQKTPPLPPNNPTPGKLLHDAIARNDWQAAEAVLLQHGAAAGSAKNSNGSTPLHLAANGKCGKNNSHLLEALLTEGNGGARSAAERNRKGKTAADIAESFGDTALAIRLRALEDAAEASEKFHRCPRCKAKLRSRSQLAFVRDCVMRGEEKNDLVLELFREHPLAVERLDVAALHRVNCCLSFRKELTESMALVSELKKIRREADDSSNCSSSSWRGWHLVDLCSGAQCVTASLCLSIFPGVSVTALDILPSDQLPHFEDVAWTTSEIIVGDNKKGNNGCGGRTISSEEETTTKDVGANNDNGNDTTRSSFSYMQRDIHDGNLALELRSHIISNGAATTTYTGKRVIVLAMHCCGALSRRALRLFTELDAAAVLVMPCCLPPKVPRAATSWNPRPCAGNDDAGGDGDAKAMAEVFATSDQEEQYQRWARYLRQCAVAADARSMNEGTGNVNVVTKLREVDAVLSSRNTLITAIRIGSALTGAAQFCQTSSSKQKRGDLVEAKGSQRPVKNSRKNNGDPPC